MSGNKITCYLVEGETRKGELILTQSSNPDGTDYGFWRLLKVQPNARLVVEETGEESNLQPFDYKMRIGDTQSILSGYGGENERYSF